MTYRERMCMAKSKLPHPAPRAEDGFKYKPCPYCGSSYWMVDYSKVKVLTCGDCGKQWLKGDVYVDG
jgi:ribosomal protein S27AE